MPSPLKLNFLGVLLAALLTWPAHGQDTNGIIVLQSDKGTRQGAVAQMKGVALTVDPKLQIVDSTHEIVPFNVWEAAQRLSMTVPFFPAGTVFVSAVDNGPLEERRAVVMLTESGHLIATPDNGSLTLVAESLGVEQVREIEASREISPGASDYYTYLARDIFAQAAAELASGQRGFERIGPSLDSAYVALTLEPATAADGVVTGTVSLVHEPFGNLWTNIDGATFDKLNADYGDKLEVTITEGDRIADQHTVAYVAAYPDVAPGDPLVLLNNVGNMSLALSFGNFAQAFDIGTGPAWRIQFEAAS
ncbi:MAG: SAM-dependent chlorinase/fluorinase [Pseudomonadota bacterium]